MVSIADIIESFNHIRICEIKFIVINEVQNLTRIKMQINTNKLDTKNTRL